MKSINPNLGLKQEANLFCKYLIGQPASQSVIKLYSDALKSSSNDKLLNFALAHPYLIGVIDSGAALVLPESELRRRIYYMLAILEAQPENSAKFLAKKHSPFYLIVISLAGIRAVLKAIAGIFVIKLVART